MGRLFRAIGALLCDLDWHRWRHIWGTFNRYFECDRCEARMMRTGCGGYQPVDGEWLHRMRPMPSRPRMHGPAGGWDGHVVSKRVQIPAERPPAEAP